MKKYRVRLKKREVEYLEETIRSRSISARKRKNAQILLKSNESKGGPGWRDEKICEAFDAGVRTVERVRRRFVESGMEIALKGEESSRVYERKLDGDGEAQLIALACSEAPEGRSTWTMKLLGERLVALEVVNSISENTILRTLKKMN